MGLGLGLGLDLPLNNRCPRGVVLDGVQAGEVEQVEARARARRPLEPVHAAAQHAAQHELSAAVHLRGTCWRGRACCDAVAGVWELWSLSAVALAVVGVGHR